jgi:hypothetical protein
MPGVRKVLSQNIQNLPNLSMKQTLKVAARFVQRRPEEMQRVFDKAKARKEVPVAVYEAIQRLWKNQGIANSYDLNFMNLVREELKRHEGTKNSQRLNNADYNVAVNDSLWKATVGSGKGNLAILLKKRETDGSRPALRALEADLHKAAKGDPEKYETALKLAALLDAVNKSPTQDGSPFEGWADSLEKLGLGPMFATPIFSAINKNDFQGLAICIGEALTKLLNPRLEFALADAKRCPTLPEGIVDHEYLMNLFEHYSNVLSSPEVWSMVEKAGLQEYYGLASSITALRRLATKESCNENDVKLLLGTLKTPTIPGNVAKPKNEEDADFEHVVEQSENMTSKASARDKIESAANSRKSFGKILCEFGKAVFDHYHLNLKNHDYLLAAELLDTAQDSNDVINALEGAFAAALQNTKMGKSRFIEPIENAFSAAQSNEVDA